MLLNLWTKYSYIIILLMLIFSFFTFKALEMDPKPQYGKIKIEQNDSLWTLAEQYAPTLSMSSTEFIQWVQDKNELTSLSISEGDILTIPIHIDHLHNIDGTNAYQLAFE